MGRHVSPNFRNVQSVRYDDFDLVACLPSADDIYNRTLQLFLSKDMDIAMIGSHKEVRNSEEWRFGGID